MTARNPRTHHDDVAPIEQIIIEGEISSKGKILELSMIFTQKEADGA